MSPARPALKRRMEAARPRLYRTALSWCRDRSLAEDLAQETLVKALSKVGQLRSIDAIDGWLFRIMANLWRDHVRRDHPTDPVEDVDVPYQVTPEQLSSQNQEIERVQRALAALPEGYRLAISLVDIEGFSYSETAEIIGVPVGTIMSRLSRGRRRLAELLKESGDAAGESPDSSHIKQIK